MKKLLLTTCAALSLVGCARNQDGSINWTQTTQNYVAGANATAGVLKQIGNDIVTFDCANADLLYVIAKDAGAASRVQSALGKNAQIAKDTCPAMDRTAKIVVQSGTVVSSQ